MRCPYCGAGDDRVVDSRESREGAVIRRRRECNACERRFTSYETVEEIPLLVVKKDGRREPFDRNKLLRGLMKACEKRPVETRRSRRSARRSSRRSRRASRGRCRPSRWARASWRS